MKNINYMAIIAVTLIALITNACNSKAEDKLRYSTIPPLGYTVQPISEPIVYGINIKKIIKQNFAKIEQELGSRTVIDQGSTAIIEREEDFVLKTRTINSKDSLHVIYQGPIDESTIYSKLDRVLPDAIFFYGAFKINEDINIKRTIIMELGKNLPQNDTTKEILGNIEQTFITGSYYSGTRLKINFDMPDFPLAYFTIEFSPGGIIFYEYAYSKKIEVNY